MYLYVCIRIIGGDSGDINNDADDEFNDDCVLGCKWCVCNNVYSLIDNVNENSLIVTISDMIRAE